MKRWLTILGVVAVASPALAQSVRSENGNIVHVYPDQAHAQAAHDANAARPGGGGGQLLVNHGGPVLAQAKVVSIFWGPSWGTQSNPGTTASHITGFFANFGSTGEWKTIDQYGAHSTNLTNTAWFDSTNPPHTAVSDSDVQAEVLKYINGHGGVPDDSTVYEVFIPNGFYATLGSNSDSCGGPSLAFCAYHGNFSGLGHDIKYSSMPYPSCGGCQSAGFTVEQNLDHFSCHETREAATDPDLNAWYDRRGNEADDKCAWSPTPFIDAGFGYQYEWSNADGGCVQKK